MEEEEQEEEEGGIRSRDAPDSRTSLRVVVKKSCLETN